MTLLVNEIHVGGDLRNSFIVATADRRITKVGTGFDSDRRKLFKFRHLNAAVGYFGLAQPTARRYFSDWVANFINSSTRFSSLEELAHNLYIELNRAVDKRLLKAYPSGFHICGYNSQDFPELWFVRNIGGMEGPRYTDFRSEYFLTEDFLSRDARTQGFDGTSPIMGKNFVQYYINGDVRPFHGVWQKLDEFASQMLSQSDFNMPSDLSDNEKFVEWKMRVISSFYKRFAKIATIGEPIDVLTLVPSTFNNLT